MKYSKSSPISERSREKKVTHPMIVYGAGAATIAVACNSAANALALSLIMLILCTAMSLVYMFERGEYIQPMRTVLYFVPSAIVTFLCGLALNAVFPNVAVNLGLYLPLLASDGLVLVWLDEDAPFVPPTRALFEALRLWWTYASLALPIGILREMLSSGSIFGHAILFIDGTEPFKYPFAGFILLGFGLAAAKRLDNKD